MWRKIKPFVVVLFLISVWPSQAMTGAFAQTKSNKSRAKAASAEPEDFVIDESLDPTGRPDVESLLGDNLRYYVWFHDREWHLRTTTSKYTRRFDGVISIKGGKFTKCRSIGNERKGRKNDAWRLSPDRTKLEFSLVTKKKFDGFDFRISSRDAIVQFDLKVAKKERPKSIFIGRELQHPKHVKFALPADPGR